MIKFDFETYRKNIISDDEIRSYDNKLATLNSYFDKHKNLMGWFDVNSLKNSNLIEDINETSKYIKRNCDVFLVVGIGGSYLGSLSVIEALVPYFYNDVNKPEIHFMGTSLSSEYINDLKELIINKDIIVNFISKSGSTFETIITYNLVMEMMSSKYEKEELSKRIIITTEDSENKLFNDAKENNYKLFNIPEDIGGRYSVCTSAGLLPIAVSGININELIDGSIDSMKSMDNQIKYAVIRDIMRKKGKNVEVFVVYEPKLYAFTEWIKQLYAESLGKNEGGILPIGMINTRDLHSLGQYIQEGSRILFETVINIESSSKDIYIKEYEKGLNDINNIASSSTSISHYKVNVLNNIINLDALNTYNIGYLLQFFMVSCVVSAHLQDVNAFDQEGVSEYKNVMNQQLIR